MSGEGIPNTVIVAGIAISVLVVAGVQIYMNTWTPPEPNNDSDSDSDSSDGDSSESDDEYLPFCDETCTPDDLGYFGSDQYQD